MRTCNQAYFRYEAEHACDQCIVQDMHVSEHGPCKHAIKRISATKQNVLVINTLYNVARHARLRAGTNPITVPETSLLQGQNHLGSM